MNSKIELPPLLLPFRVLPRYGGAYGACLTPTPAARRSIDKLEARITRADAATPPRSKMNGASEIREIFRLPDLSADIRGITVHRAVRLIDAWSFAPRGHPR